MQLLRCMDAEMAFSAGVRVEAAIGSACGRTSRACLHRLLSDAKRHGSPNPAVNSGVRLNDDRLVSSWPISLTRPTRGLLI